jgi:hypothetical protein
MASHWIRIKLIADANNFPADPQNHLTLSCPPCETTSSGTNDHPAFPSTHRGLYHHSHYTNSARMGEDVGEEPRKCNFGGSAKLEIYYLVPFPLKNQKDMQN